MKCFVCNAIFILALGHVAMIAKAADAQALPVPLAGSVVVRPEDSGEALVNPGMGWTLHFYSNFIENYGSKLAPSDTVDDWPGLSVIYLRVPWSYLEPKEGEFNWSLFDTPAQRWIAKGKRIAIRVSCSESWLRYATPKWVEEAGARGVEFEFGKGPKAGGPLWDPDYLDPVFLKKLESFLAAMAQRYDANPNVAFIDIGSFGMWGEGHTGFSSRLNEEQTLAVTKRHIDLHVKHFKHTLLCISDDVAGATKPGRHFPAMDYALSKNVTMRDDSILSALVDETFDLKQLNVGPPGEPIVEKRQSRFVIALPLVDPRGTHAPPTKPGVYDVFVSVGQRDGTPEISLPLPGHDGQRRYKLGTIRLIAAAK